MMSLPEKNEGESPLVRHHAAMLAGAAAYGAAETLLAIIDADQALLTLDDAASFDEQVDAIAAYILDRDIQSPETVWRRFHASSLHQGDTALPWPTSVTPEWALALDVFCQVARIVGGKVKAAQEEAAKRTALAVQAESATPPKVRDTIFERHGSAFERTEAFLASAGQSAVQAVEQATGINAVPIDSTAQDDGQGTGLTINAETIKGDDQDASEDDGEDDGKPDGEPAATEATPPPLTKAEKRAARKNKNQR